LDNVKRKRDMDEIEYEEMQEQTGIGQQIADELADYFGANESAESWISRAEYKVTECGAWVHLTERGFDVGIVVEGSDAEFSASFVVQGELRDGEIREWLDMVIPAIEEQADEAWREANELRRDDFCDWTVGA